MKTESRKIHLRLPAILLAACSALLTGCESTGDDGGAADTGGYYGSDWYGYGYDADVDRPVGGNIGGPRPSHPIAIPPSQPMPMHRPSFRR